jgi:hypothetical protein
VEQRPRTAPAQHQRSREEKRSRPGMREMNGPATEATSEMPSHPPATRFCGRLCPECGRVGLCVPVPLKAAGRGCVCSHTRVLIRIAEGHAPHRLELASSPVV